MRIQIILPQHERLELSLVSDGDSDAEMIGCEVIVNAPRRMYLSLYNDFEIRFQDVD